MGVDPVVEVLEVVLVESVANDFNVELVKVLVAERALEVRSQRSLDQNAVVQLFNVCGDAKGGHGLEPAEGVASIEQFAGVSLVQCSSNEEGDIVNHVSVGQKLHELGQRTSSVGLNVAELINELVEQLVGEGTR